MEGEAFYNNFDLFIKTKTIQQSGNKPIRLYDIR